MNFLILLAAVLFAQDLGLPVSGALQAASQDAPSENAARLVWSPGTEKGLEGEWRELVKTLDPEVAAFLKETKARIVVEPPRPGMFDQMAGQVAQYEAGVIYVNADMMRRFGEEVFAKAPAADALRHLALLTLPVVSHEARHGISRRKIEAAQGADYPWGSVEDEIVAFAHQALVAHTIDQAHGRELAPYAGTTIAGECRTLLVKLKFGGIVGGTGLFGGVDEMVRSALRYSSHPELSKGDWKKLEDLAESALASNTRRAAALRSRLAAASEADAPKIAGALETAEREIAKAEAAKVFLADKKKRAALVDFYAKETAALQAAWEQMNAAPAGSSR